MRPTLRILVVLAGLGAVAGAAIVFLGLYNVSARVGHYPGVSWVLHTTFRNSVELRAPPPAEVPRLDDAERAALGARHFDAACAMCHGAPGEDRTATIRAMVPVPPPIGEAIAPWSPEELFWILREGIKMSGMPAWPSGREDEVWAVVAFLEALRALPPEDYPALIARGDGSAFAYCASCHGREGRSGNRYIPRLDILDESDIASALATYAGGSRASGIMQHAASEFDPATLARIAARYGAVAPDPAPWGTKAPAEVIARGEALASASARDRDVPACRACHGPGRDARLEAAPALGGQSETYLARQLRLWHAGQRGGGQRAHLMTRAASELTEQDIAALAAYYASRSPEGLEPGD